MGGKGYEGSTLEEGEGSAGQNGKCDILHVLVL